MNVSQLFQYPLKSCKASEATKLEIVATGVRNDRVVAAMDAQDTVLTARTHPMLLQVSARITDDQLTLEYPGLEQLKAKLPDKGSVERSFRMFDHDLTGHTLSSEVDLWISDVLRTDAQLIVLKNDERPMLARHNAKEGDITTLTDASPIHLLSTASLEELNRRLGRQFPIHQFRPNVVIDGCDPHEEDNWKEVRIGDCVFEVQMACPRCVLSTINPETGVADPQSEPLRAWAGYRKAANNKVNFGTYLIPRKLGVIEVGMEVIVMQAGG
ncbi:MAG: MOSC N-terminal beta barrel domain-containing protein [Bacteroidota bacterium]